ncbi:GIY-YIG nuclease family protein [Herbaspirillum huttiense]|uniref:GIY-YIG nuclease family protein n=1 Tax=Herbaspirillum TaxID=963 RepID=UPI0035C755CB
MQEPTPDPWNRTNVRRLRAHWIYSLTAYSRDGERKACYIGQTVNLIRRFREHLLRHRTGRTSFAFFEWAANERVEVRATVLTQVQGHQGDASRIEAYWLKLAVEDGFLTPDSHRWGRSPQADIPPGHPSRWPSADVLVGSIALTDLVAQGLIPSECLKPIVAMAEVRDGSQ